jgi:hypothetical protein
MADYTDNALLASIKALDNVVRPALDPNDPLANEQLHLVSGFLKFLRTRLPHWQSRNHFELEHYRTMAEDVLGDARTACPDLSVRLEQAISRAKSVALREGAAASEIQSNVADLSMTISELARMVADSDPDLRARVESTITVRSKRWIDMQRSWFLPQGFDLHPDEVPSLDAILGSTASSASGT